MTTAKTLSETLRPIIVDDEGCEECERTLKESVLQVTKLIESCLPEPCLPRHIEVKSISEKKVSVTKPLIGRELGYNQALAEIKVNLKEVLK